MITVSPSQISTYLDCPRKWGFSSLLGLRRSSAAAELGSEVHKHRELYLRDGTPIDQTAKAGQIASVGLSELPTPKDPMIHVEHEFWLEKTGGYHWHGLIDVVENLPDRLIIYDHKSTKDFRYAKTDASLAVDPQWLIYTDWAFDLRQDLDEIETRWLYLRTKAPYRSLPVYAVAKRDDEHRLIELAKLEKTSETLYQIRKNPPVNISDLDADLESCSKYGGCPYAGRECKQTQNISALFAPIETSKEMSNPLMDKLAQFRKQTEAKGAQIDDLDDDVPDVETAEEEAPKPPVKRGPGRPPGSKNKATIEADKAEEPACKAASSEPSAPASVTVNVDIASLAKAIDRLAAASEKRNEGDAEMREIIGTLVAAYMASNGMG